MNMAEFTHIRDSIVSYYGRAVLDEMDRLVENDYAAKNIDMLQILEKALSNLGRLRVIPTVRIQ